jgi:hypothetical protein
MTMRKKVPRSLADRLGSVVVEAPPVGTTPFKMPRDDTNGLATIAAIEPLSAASQATRSVCDLVGASSIWQWLCWMEHEYIERDTKTRVAEERKERRQRNSAVAVPKKLRTTILSRKTLPREVRAILVDEAIRLVEATGERPEPGAKPRAYGVAVDVMAICVDGGLNYGAIADLILDVNVAWPANPCPTLASDYGRPGRRNDLKKWLKAIVRRDRARKRGVRVRYRFSVSIT